MFGPLPAAFGAPSEHLERPGRAVIADFLRKVLKLGLLRLADLCERMEFEPLDRQDILTQVQLSRLSSASLQSPWTFPSSWPVQDA